MPKRSSKKPPSDANEAAAWIVASITGQTPPPIQGKNPAAVALGRMGGLIGGRARATKLSKSRRKEIAKKAARVRWSKPS